MGLSMLKPGWLEIKATQYFFFNLLKVLKILPLSCESMGIVCANIKYTDYSKENWMLSHVPKHITCTF